MFISVVCHPVAHGPTRSPRHGVVQRLLVGYLAGGHAPVQLDELGTAPEALVEGGVERRHQLAATVAHDRVHVRPVVEEDLRAKVASQKRPRCARDIRGRGNLLIRKSSNKRALMV